MKHGWDTDLQPALFVFFDFWCGHDRAYSPRTMLRESHQKKFLEKNLKYLNKSERFRVFHLFLLFSVGWKYQSVNLNLPTISTKLPFVQIRPRLCLHCSFNISSCLYGCTWGEFIVYLCRQWARYAPSEILICFNIHPPPQYCISKYCFSLYTTISVTIL